MRISPLIFLLMYSFVAIAQETIVERRYYSEKGERIEDQSLSHYYSVDSTVGDYSSINSFYTKSGKPRVIEQFGSINHPRKKIEFYESGQMMSQATIRLHRPVGMVTMWYSNGQTRCQLQFLEDAKHPMLDFRIVNYWDSLGNKLVDQGNGSGEMKFISYVQWHSGNGVVADGIKIGLWKGTNSVGTYEEEYKDGKIVRGATTKEGVTYPYTSMEQSAEPQGGMAEFYRVLSRAMKYPKFARKQGIDGKVFVEFVVDADGSIRDIKTVKSVHPALDAEAERCVALSPVWRPGRQRGIPVRQRMVIPIMFKFS